MPVSIPAIFVPFFLTHDRLRQLERKIILEVEGETPEWFMKLIRHEAAHAYAFAYQFVRKRKWQRLFGKSSSDETPSFYRPHPYSRSFVTHLDDWYAQSHPDEDFAETFAVWLTPGLDWRARYKDWRALEKLEYVDELMRSLAGKPPLPMPEYRVADYDCLNIKLKTYYAKKRKEYEHSFPDFYDNDLRQLFVPSGQLEVHVESLRSICVGTVANWKTPSSSGQMENKYRVNQLLTRLIARCDKLNSADHRLQSETKFIRGCLHHHVGDEPSVHWQIQTHEVTVKKKLKILALFDAIAPTTIDQDLTKEVKTEDWKTEANVLTALTELGHTTEHLAIFDDLNLLAQKLDSFQPDIIFNLADQF